MTNDRQRLGAWGEQVAIGHLLGQGYTILTRNFRTPHGELDVVCSKDDLLLFVEVKTLSSRAFANPEDAVTPRKMEHMQRAAEHYISLHPDCPETWQYDVIAVERVSGDEPRVVQFENVIA